MVLYLLYVKHSKEVNFDLLVLIFFLKFFIHFDFSVVKLRRVKDFFFLKKKKKGKRLTDFMRCIYVDCDFYVVE